MLRRMKDGMAEQTGLALASTGRDDFPLPGGAFSDNKKDAESNLPSFPRTPRNWKQNAPRPGTHHRCAETEVDPRPARRTTCYVFNPCATNLTYVSTT